MFLFKIDLIYILIEFTGFRDFNKPEILIVNPSDEVFDHPAFPMNVIRSGDHISLSNSYMSAQFNQSGFIKSVLMNGQSFPLKIGMYQ